MNRRTFTLPVLCLATFVAPIFSQTPASFSTYSTSTTPIDVNAYVPTSVAIDVNNDGVQDVVQITPVSSGYGFVVQIANGDGTFKPASAPIVVDPSNKVSQIASGDFNRDGKVDLAFAVQGTTKLLLYLGNGDGTFQAPKTFSYPLPDSANFAQSILIAGDMNQDGNLDLIAETDSLSQDAFEVVTFAGDGAGNFSAPVQSWVDYSEVAPGPTFLTGDFNGDSIPDIAFDLTGAYFSGDVLVVLLGYGNLQFKEVIPFSGFSSAFPFGVGDLNHDGNTDIFGIDVANQKLDIIYGNKSGSFAINSQTPVTNVYPLGYLKAADFNGDGRMDIVATANSTQMYNRNTQVVFFYGNSTGTYTQMNEPIPNQGTLSDPMVGEFHHSIRPDLALQTQTASATNPELIVEVNNTSAGYWGSCHYPALGEGIGVCAPQSQAGSPVQFKASANSFGQLRKIELWVDGAKIGEQYNVWENRAWFTMSKSLAAGTHHGTYIRNDVDNRFQRQDFTFTVQ